VHEVNPSPDQLGAGVAMIGRPSVDRNAPRGFARREALKQSSWLLSSLRRRRARLNCACISPAWRHDVMTAARKSGALTLDICRALAAFLPRKPTRRVPIRPAFSYPNGPRRICT
jgi:hypothetical protein